MSTLLTVSHVTANQVKAKIKITMFRKAGYAARGRHFSASLMQPDFDEIDGFSPDEPTAVLDEWFT